MVVVDNQLPYFLWQKLGINFGFKLNWQILLKKPQHVATLLIRKV
jgi:hypothetical protein